jgi:hypothetical protein
LTCHITFGLPTIRLAARRAGIKPPSPQSFLSKLDSEPEKLSVAV